MSNIYRLNEYVRVTKEVSSILVEVIVDDDVAWDERITGDAIVSGDALMEMVVRALSFAQKIEHIRRPGRIAELELALRSARKHSNEVQKIEREKTDKLVTEIHHLLMTMASRRGLDAEKLLAMVTAAAEGMDKINNRYDREW